MRIKFMSLIQVAVILLMAGCSASKNQASSPLVTIQPQADALTAIYTRTAPLLDGSADDTAWRVAPAPVLQANGDGVKPYPVTLKAAYDDQAIYLLVQFLDANMEVDRSPWAFDTTSHTWGRLGDDLGDEDEMGFFWNVNVPNYQAKGCQDLCHSDDPDNTMMYTPQGSWVDVWGWNGARTNAMGWARHMKLTDDPKASPDAPYGMVNQAGFETNSGFADNVQAIDGVEVPAYWKPYSGTGGVVTGDRLFLLQSEIDAGDAKKITKLGLDGTLTDETGAVVPFTARIPGRILSLPAGPSWNEVGARGAWLNGVWTIEFSRSLQTGREEDVQFSADKSYYFDIYFKTRLPGEKDREIVTVSKLVFTH